MAKNTRSGLDKAIFNTALQETSSNLQKVVPIKKKEETEVQVNFRMSEDLKKQIDIYIARAGRELNLALMGAKAFEEYMANHPIAE